jgi:hypothetical protein
VSATGSGELLRLGLVGEQDVFVLRQRGREVAALVGLEYPDQVRVATALSELARELVVLSSPSTITLSLVRDASPALMVTATWLGLVPGVTSAAELAAVGGIAAAARLTDTCEVRCNDTGGSVSLTKRLPMSAPSPTETRIAELREAAGIPGPQARWTTSVARIKTCCTRWRRCGHTRRICCGSTPSWRRPTGGAGPARRAVR